MTTVFWLSAASMSLVAILFAILPLLRSKSASTVTRQLLNTEVIREQLNELRADLESGKLDEDAYQAARRDLERELLNDTELAAAGDAQPERSGRWAIGLFGVLIPALAVLMYLQLGAAPLLEQPASAPVARQQPAEEQQGHPLQDMVEQLARRLQEDPGNAEGWVLLGRSYAALNRYQEAANAYAEARRIAGDQPQLLIDSADIVAMANDGRFTAEAGQLLQRALQSQPENAKGLWLMGHYRYQEQDFQGAIEYWQRAAAQLPADSEDGAAIRQQIKQAESRLGAAGATLTAEVPSADQPAPAVDASAIEVSVRLDPALNDETSPTDTVFIFARAAQGPRMPLAIVRKQVSELPVTVTLDDSLAMTPAMVISNFSEVTVGARISKSGNAMPQSGDLEGTVSPVQVQAGASARVIINQSVP